MIFLHHALRLVGVSLLLNIAALAATPREYTVREWHENDGLPSEEIDNLTIDGDGYLWIAGAGKFARFDGTTFTPYEIPDETVDMRGFVAMVPSVANTTSLAAPGWTSNDAPPPSQNAKSIYYTWRGETLASHTEPLLEGKSVKVVFSQRDGALWLGSDDGTVVRKTPAADHVYATPQGTDKKRPPAFATDSDGKTWCLNSGKISFFEGESWHQVELNVTASALRLISSRTGGPWLMTHNAVCKWTQNHFATIATINDEIGAHFVQAALEDRQGSLWFGTRSQGLRRIVGSEVLHVATSHADITALQEDLDGNIWVGTNGGGLLRLKTKMFWLYDKSSGLSDDYSHSVSTDSTGVIWLANRDGGVARIRDGAVDPLSKRAGWRSFSAKSVSPAPNGYVWIATGIGIHRTTIQNPERIERVLADARTVRVTFVARNNDCWFALDPGKIVRWRDGETKIYSTTEGLDVREIRAIGEDTTGRIWVGADDGRLYRIRADDTFERIPIPLADDCGLLQAFWFGIDGTVLIGTTRKGVLILPQGQPTGLRQLSTKQGLPNSDITNILQDDMGRYWFASRGGIFSVPQGQLHDFVEGKTKQVHAVLVGKDQGMPQLSVLGRTQPSACKAPDGTLWFATRKGVVRVDPSLAPELPGPAPAQIAEIRCDGQILPKKHTLRIQSTVRKIEIRLSVLSLSIPEQTVIRHHLEGFDNDWVQSRNDRIATYPRLPPGIYTLRAEVSDGANTWSEQPPLLTLHVVPPWWQSTPALLAYAAAFILALTLVVRLLSYQRLRRRLATAEREKTVERERTRIARNIHDDLGASLTRINLLTQAAQQKNPAQTPELDEIFETVRDSTRSLDEIVWAVNPKWDDVENLVSYVGNYAQRFLGSAGLRRTLQLPPLPPPIKLPSQARHNLFMCCKEILNNIVKHARATEVTLTIEATENRLLIVITDDGVGFPNYTNQTELNFPSHRNGLHNMHARMEEIGGHFKIGSRENGGTRAILELPLPLREQPATTPGAQPSIVP